MCTPASFLLNISDAAHSFEKKGRMPGDPSLSEDDIQELGRCLANHHKLRKLLLQRNKLGDNGAAVIAAALQVNSSLEYLNLQDVGIGEAGGKEFAEALRVNNNLVRLDLLGNRLRDVGSIAIFKALCENRKLKHLNLTRNALKVSTAIHVAECLRKNTTLEELILGWNILGGCSAIKFICTGLAVNETLTSLNLSRNGLDDTDILHLSTCLMKNSTLRVLDLSFNQSLSGKSGEYLANALSCNGSLKLLHLLQCGIDHSGIVQIARAVRQSTALEELVLPIIVPSAGLGREIGTMLAQNKSLIALDLRRRAPREKYTPFAAHVFSGLGKNTTLRSLRISTNIHLQSPFTHSVSSAIQNTNLSYLKLEGLGIPAASAKLLFEGLQTNKHLLGLSVTACKELFADDNVFQTVVKSLETNTALLSVKIRGLDSEVNDSLKFVAHTFGKRNCEIFLHERVSTIVSTVQRAHSLEVVEDLARIIMAFCMDLSRIFVSDVDMKLF